MITAIRCTGSNPAAWLVHERAIRSAPDSHSHTQRLADHPGFRGHDRDRRMLPERGS